MNVAPSNSPLKMSLSRPTGQVQIALEDKPLFVASDAIEFLGKEAAATIGDGARWRHPYPQTWAWPPKEPASIVLKTEQPDQQRASVKESEFVAEYESRPSLLARQEPGAVHLRASLENLGEDPKQAWIVAPFATPAGHRADRPAALAVFPASPRELDAVPDSDLPHPRWSEDHANGLMFVNPGGAKVAEQEDKLLLPDRWSLFAREGDASVMLMPPTGSHHPEAFQVYAGFDSYVELEWAGEPAPQGGCSQVETSFHAVPLTTLDLGEGSLQHFGQSGEGLQSELTRVVKALGLEGRE